MFSYEQLTKALTQLSEEQAKALLMEIFTARQYGNQEMIQTLNAIAERLEEDVK